jgi:hypothetical protein
VTLALAPPVGADLLVVRGCGFTCTVRLSADGTSFGPPTGPADDALGDTYVLPLPTAPGAAVRVETATGGFFDSLREVSVFP